jgi:hypothetical protein
MWCRKLTKDAKCVDFEKATGIELVNFRGEVLNVGKQREGLL